VIVERYPTPHKPASEETLLRQRSALPLRCRDTHEGSSHFWLISILRQDTPAFNPRLDSIDPRVQIDCSLCRVCFDRVDDNAFASRGAADVELLALFAITWSGGGLCEEIKRETLRNMVLI